MEFTQTCVVKAENLGSDRQIVQQGCSHSYVQSRHKLFSTKIYVVLSFDKHAKECSTSCRNNFQLGRSKSVQAIIICHSNRQAI